MVQSMIAARLEIVKVIAVSWSAGRLGVQVVNRASEAQSRMAPAPVRVARRRRPACEGAVEAVMRSGSEAGETGAAMRGAARGRRQIADSRFGRPFVGKSQAAIK